jgi:hypothetical protein
MTLAALGGCEMKPAETLGSPRILAIRTTPPALSPGESHVLEALSFEVAGPIAWSYCRDAWQPTEPLSCASGAVALGQGNPLTVTLPDGVESLWLRAEATDGEALPAVKLVSADSDAQNPEVLGVTGENGALPANVAVGAAVVVKVALGDEASADKQVVSWYVTVGELEPAVILASETSTWTMPAVAGAARLIAVVREKAGGTGWAESALTIGGAP